MRQLCDTVADDDPKSSYLSAVIEIVSNIPDDSERVRMWHIRCLKMELTPESIA
jgi:hypothetical protein